MGGRTGGKFRESRFVRLERPEVRALLARVDVALGDLGRAIEAAGWDAGTRTGYEAVLKRVKQLREGTVG